MSTKPIIAHILALLAVAACQSQAPQSSADATKPATAKKKLTKTPTRAAEPSGYNIPSKEVVEIVDALPTPRVEVGPKGRWIMLSTYDALPSIATVAEPFAALAGIRIDADRNMRRNLRSIVGLSFTKVSDETKVAVQLPANAKIIEAEWSPDGNYVAFGLITAEGVQPWVVEVLTGKARRLSTRHLNNVLGSPIEWMPGSTELLLRLVDNDRGPAPAASHVPNGPSTQDTSGRKAQNRTYQDLLTNAYDESRFNYYATSELARIDLTSGTLTTLGKPGLFTKSDPSPDGQRLLIEHLEAPFSYQVPYYRFAHRIEVWDRSGKPVHTVAKLDVADAVPIQGVPTGPRKVYWQPLHDARLVWAEALDGGDPRADVPHRDRVLVHSTPFAGEPQEFLKTKHRFRYIDWTERRDELLVTEYDRDRKWVTTTLHAANAPPRTIFDRSSQDRYGDPGRPVRKTLASGDRVIIVEDESIYLSGSGATPKGDRPFLDQRKLADGSSERLFRSTEASYEYFVGFIESEAEAERSILIRRESPKEAPNYFVRKGDQERALTHFADPHPQLTGIEKRLLTYQRKDGLPLSGTLYLPPGYVAGTKVPLLLWAYPLEYTDKSTAGQVRAQPNRFTRLAGTSPLMFLTQGYAVLGDAAMPVVGHPETMNDTFVSQIVAAAQAAIDAVVAEGVADRDRVAVAGHSYGAFMTANLLAHSDLFRAGIARSGAYNRTLTPFGFQSERRTLWEATDAYIRVSPLFAATSINEPLLLIHGENDNNAGTYPLQSKRLFHALKGAGGTARLVMLPRESHGYRARESVLHVLAESIGWLDKHLKQSPSEVAKTNAG